MNFHIKDKQIHILRGKLLDLDTIWSLETNIFPESDRFSRRRLCYLLSSANASLFLSAYEQHPVGYGISLLTKLRNQKIKGRIYSLGILPQWRNNGWGSQLLVVMEAWLIDMGSEYITLETRSSREGAAPFFSKKGYQSVESLPYYYGTEHGIRMKKNVHLARQEPLGGHWFQPL